MQEVKGFSQQKT